MIKIAVFATFIAMSLVGSALAGGRPPKAPETVFLFKPGVDVPKKITRKYKQHKYDYFGALVINRLSKDYDISVDGVLSARAAVDLALLVCKEKSKAPEGCEVLALAVPPGAPASFDQALKSRGYSKGCLQALLLTRDPTRRSWISSICEVDFVPAEGMGRNGNDMRLPGHTLVWAYNDLLSGILLVAANPKGLKEKALNICKEHHESMIKELTKPGVRISAQRVPIIRVFLTYAASNPDRVKCRIGGVEILK